MKTSIITLFLLFFFVSGFAQSQDNGKKAQLSVEETTTVQPANGENEEVVDESKNPEDFGYEKKMVNGKTIYYRKNKKVHIVYEPK